MAGPTTEYLAEQLDRVRDRVDALGKEVQGARAAAVDGLRDLGDTLSGELTEVREQVGGELNALRQEVATGREAFRMEQSALREDIARLETRMERLATQESVTRLETRMEGLASKESVARLEIRMDELTTRFDRSMEFLRKLLFAAIGLGVTILGAILGTSAQAIWNASRWYATVEDQGRRLETLETQVGPAAEAASKRLESIEARVGRTNEAGERLERSIERIQKSLEAGSGRPSPRVEESGQPKAKSEPGR